MEGMLGEKQYDWLRGSIAETSSGRSGVSPEYVVLVLPGIKATALMMPLIIPPQCFPTCPSRRVLCAPAPAAYGRVGNPNKPWTLTHRVPPNGIAPRTPAAKTTPSKATIFSSTALSPLSAALWTHHLNLSHRRQKVILRTGRISRSCLHARRSSTRVGIARRARGPAVSRFCRRRRE